jgi:hypothetical protein
MKPVSTYFHCLMIEIRVTTDLPPLFWLGLVAILNFSIFNLKTDITTAIAMAI